MQHRKRLGRAVAAVASTSLIGVSFVATGGAAQAAVSTTAPVIINEVYGGGGNSGATYTHDYIELLNVSGAPVDLNGWSVQYAAAAGTSWGGVIPLSGSIAPGAFYLVAGASGASGSALPVSPQASGNVNLSGTNGNVALVSRATSLTCATAACATDPAVVDLVGFGSGAAFAGTAAPAPSNTSSVARKVVDGTPVNTADNGADFAATGTQTPGAANPGYVPPAPAVDKTIAEIQGTGTESPIKGTVVRTTGVVTASYKTGGFNGFVIQTPGADTTPDASDAVFVYLGSGNNPTVSIGDHVVVEGTVDEFGGLTQITTTNDKVAVDLAGTGTATVVEGPWPTTDVAREKLESMLLKPTGPFTVSNTYSTNQYGEVGLASGTKPLIQWTDVARPSTPEADAVKADNAARGVTLDDGATTNYLAAANQSSVPPFVSQTNPVRVGAPVTFSEPVVVDYRNGTWKLNPTSQLLAGAEGDLVTIENTRTAAPDAARLGDGDIKLASFNVLNYFTTLGANIPGCSSYNDRAGNGITVNTCTGNGPRGAWDAASLARQQAKIVSAINTMDADVIGLLEIENSAKLGETADEATATLVDALNAADPSKSWDYVRSSLDLPVVAQQDVISNAIIYQSDVVEPVGPSRALGDQSATGQPFVNAREPLAQAFTSVDGGEPFLLVVNHFKSKGSAGPLAGDADTGDGQGASNASRVAQATALKNWVPKVLVDLSYGGVAVDDVALVGDFNSYSQEDPLQVLYSAGYKNADKQFNGDELFSYSFSGLSGSLDHVLLNDSFLARSTGADVWNINSGETIAFEYSRYNSHGETFHEATPYRSSDHDPVIVAFDEGTATAPTTKPLNLLNINDFHGRIDGDTVKFAGTIEKLRSEAGESNTLFLSNGDNIGASLFASSSALDKPTIDVLDALDLKASGVGNHEFDQGLSDLTGRVADEADFPYLAANVYEKGTTTPALDEYAIVDVDGVQVGVIGAVTEETPSLVTPGGIATVEFGNPVEAVNRVAARLTDGDPSNGEADVIVAQYHEGAGFGTPEGATLAQEIAAGGAFAEIVTDTSAAVDVIFTGHTHKEYVWSGPVPGDPTASRPIVQTGSYGANIGQVQLEIDPVTKDVVGSKARNVKRTTTANAPLVAAFPRVAEVSAIVDAAIAEANVKGSVKVGTITADITSAFAGGSYVDGKYVGSAPGTTTGRDDRASESALGNLVANSLRDTLAAHQAGADFGVVNPGGLRAELLYAKSGAETENGIVTFAEANAVLPFLNNLWSTTLTGAQVKTMLEQQWQTDANGNVPSRSYLQLGLSDNVTYTYDETRPAGDRITSVTINGALVTPDDTFRVGTFSFLAEGGDNFRVFKNGTGTVDTGLIDRDAWMAYLSDEDNQGLTPSFARSHAKVVGNPASVAVGSDLSFEVSKLDMTSLGSPLNTTVTATFSGGSLPAEGVKLGDFTVTGGAVTVAGTVPTAAQGATTLTLVAAPSGTTVSIPLTVTARVAVATTTTLAVTGNAVAGEPLTLTASVAPAAAGTVTFRDGSTVLGTANVAAGKASIKKALAAGSHSLTAQFVPTDAAAFTGSTSAAVAVTVKAPAVRTTTRLAVTGKAVAGEPLTLTASVAPAAAGTVTFRDGSTVLGTAKVTGGKASIKKALSAGSHGLTAQFVPADAKAFSGSTSATVSVKVAKSGTTIAAKLSKKKAAYGSPSTVTVTVKGKSAKPSGKVTVYEGRKSIASGTLKVNGNTGKVTITLPKNLSIGKHTLTVKYSGNANTEAASTAKLAYEVVKATAKVTVSVKNAGRTVSITVTAPGTKPSGRVTLAVDGRSGKAVSLKNGKATVKLGALRTGKHTYTVTYSGSSNVNKTSTTTRVNVK
ncbi:ExeM/NucH family extracellular endonuclease [Sanguibacter hominis ATCC BAA-789]|uniref:ExeM/NucH family extracellular endonuclease n=1 Tax=Sanguibacter hominis ATCC BAA-789 TaxID=1312740 RepID=A0A9X5IQX9_9MICO|nr:ExeM/NucH family extracellular endonuclease [Sanguibacter hominis]NKX92103.1 ExeM/NucH family extracellular endonuclease [Sanguibacter hominis ATCC BAA-789]